MSLQGDSEGGEEHVLQQPHVVSAVFSFLHPSYLQTALVCRRWRGVHGKKTGTSIALACESEALVAHLQLPLDNTTMARAVRTGDVALALRMVQLCPLHGQVVLDAAAKSNSDAMLKFVLARRGLTPVMVECVAVGSFCTSTAVLEAVYNRYRGVHVIAFDGFFQGAISHGNYTVLEWAQVAHQALPDHSEYTQIAAEQGDVQMLQWLHQHSCPVNCTAFVAAAKRGHLAVLQWLRAQQIQFTFVTFAAAAEAGHVHCLQWLMQEWPAFMHQQNVPARTQVQTSAARNGRLAVLQFMHEEGLVIEGERVAAAAAGAGHTHVLQWLHNLDAQLIQDSQLCTLAAESGRLGTLQWLRQNGCPWTALVCVRAAAAGHLHILEWARSQRPVCPLGTARKSAQDNRWFAIVQWIDEQPQRKRKRKHDA